MAHMNYHPEKDPRMEATIAFYNKHDRSALSKWNGGEGRNTNSCIGKVGVNTNVMPRLTATSRHSLSRNLIASGGSWGWGPDPSRLQGPCWFRADGQFESPWRNGSWGPVPSPWRNDSVHVILGDPPQIETYLLMFLSEKWAFVAVRCADERVSYGRLQGPIPEKRLVW